MASLNALKKLLQPGQAETRGVVVSASGGVAILATRTGSAEFPYSGIQPQVGQTLAISNGEAVAIILNRSLPEIHYL